MHDASKKIRSTTDVQAKVRLTPALVEGFVETFLYDTYPDRCPTPEFHRSLWRLFCEPSPRVAVAAPRGHAKSTAGNYAYILASVLFGCHDFVLLISATEDLVKPHLRNIRNQLADNEGLIEAFDIKIVKDNETELVFTTHGRMVLVMAKGAEQRLRGLNWNNQRPSLIVGDDMEDDEMVMNPERRDKFKKWFESALLPIGSRTAQFRILGTILHEGSLLEGLLGSRSWLGARFRAHRDFDDFSDILWPEYHTEESLRDIRQIYIDSSNASGYSQEYLSQPIAEHDAYFKKHTLLPMKEEDYFKPKNFYITVDFAISKKEKADNTVMMVGGVDPDGYLHIVDVRAFKGDGLEIIEEMFALEQEYRPVFWVCESGQISKALGAFLKAEMVKRNIYLAIQEVTPSVDKITRARSIQKRLQAGGVRFDHEAHWYPPLEHEILFFPRGAHDDRVDTLAYLGLILDKLQESPTAERMEEEEWEEEARESLMDVGRSFTTGY